MTTKNPVGLSVEDVAQLRRPFPFTAIRYKPQALDNKEAPTKALVTFYLDARLVAERLNHVVGPEGWSNEPEPVGIMSGGWAAMHFPIACKLTVGGITKTDVGTYQADKPDDKAVKSSYSDSLKRAAVLFGVGVYLYGGIPDLWAAVQVGRNGKVRGFSDAGRKQIEQHYTKALKALEPEFGAPLDHGLAATGDEAAGMTESEAIDSQPGHLGGSPERMEPSNGPALLSQSGRRRLMATIRDLDLDLATARRVIGTYGYVSTKEIPAADLDALIGDLKGYAANPGAGDAIIAAWREKNPDLAEKLDEKIEADAAEVSHA